MIKDRRQRVCSRGMITGGQEWQGKGGGGQSECHTITPWRKSPGCRYGRIKFYVSLFFLWGRGGNGEICRGLSRCSTDDPGPQIAIRWGAMASCGEFRALNLLASKSICIYYVYAYVIIYIIIRLWYIIFAYIFLVSDNNVTLMLSLYYLHLVKTWTLAWQFSIKHNVELRLDWFTICLNSSKQAVGWCTVFCRQEFKLLLLINKLTGVPVRPAAVTAHHSWQLQHTSFAAIYLFLHCFCAVSQCNLK